MQGHSGEHKGMQGIQGNTGNTEEYIVIQGNIGQYRIIKKLKETLSPKTTFEYVIQSWPMGIRL